MHTSRIKAVLTRHVRNVAREAGRIWEVELGRVYVDYGIEHPKVCADAGWFYPHDKSPRMHAVGINLGLADEYMEIYLREVIPHEVAHLVLHARRDLQRGNLHHCKGWRAVARSLGCTGERLITLPPSQRSLSGEFSFHR